jgi:formylglycine-generating enzyme required for sulfatase activity/serine/threonine protein phosphatase PrpC
LRIYFEIAGGQIDGARDYQEDAFLHSYLDVGEDPKGSGLVIMADGMGGHAAGNIASNLVVSTFNKTFNASFDEPDVPNVLRVALAKANGALSEAIRETPALDGMGCTMVAGVFHEGRVWWVSVGDSHLYLIRDRKLSKNNEDHSYGGYLDRMNAQGMAIEPEPGLSRNMLMSAMTGDDIAEIDCPGDFVQLLPGDRLLIASDGLDTLSAGTIVQMSAWSSTPKECVEQILKAVEDAGKPRQDNTTVIVIDAMDRDAADAPPPPPGNKPKAKAKPSVEDTQEINLSDIQELTDADDTAPGAAKPIAAEPVMKVAEPADKNEDDEDEGGLNVGRLIIALVVLFAILGGVGYGVYAMFFADGNSGPVPEVVFDPEPPKPPSAPESTVDTPPVIRIKAEPLEGGAPTQPKSSGTTAASRELVDKLSSGGEGPVMVVVAGGTFKMGKNSFDSPSEGPARDVSVPGFAVAKFEITQAQYALFANKTGRDIPTASIAGDTYPVVNVSWDDAVAYASWVSQQTGEDYRLLSEAEWEYVAGAGRAQSYWWGFDFETDRAHCFDCATDFTTSRPTRTGSFEPNPFGVHDTAGNVLEWVQDCYHANYSGAPTDASVWSEGADCSRRMARGGAYNSPSDSLQVQKRDAYNPARGRRNIGFRIAREI